MAFAVNPLTSVITIPQSDLTLISGTLYKLDTDQFRLNLKDWEDDQNGGISFLKTHGHNTEYTLVGVTYARGLLLLPPYSITFEDGQYTVLLQGSNNNFFDVEGGILNQNQVQVIPGNSAGLVVISTGSGLDTEEHDQLMQIENPPSQTLNEYKADVSGLQVDKSTEIDAINVKTDNLPVDPASQADVETKIDWSVKKIINKLIPYFYGK